jgi:hypothetical protein
MTLKMMIRLRRGGNKSASREERGCIDFCRIVSNRTARATQMRGAVLEGLQHPRGLRAVRLRLGESTATGVRDVFNIPVSRAKRAWLHARNDSARLKAEWIERIIG